MYNSITYVFFYYLAPDPWYLLWSIVCVRQCDSLPQITTCVRYHEIATDYALLLVIGVVSAKQVAGFGVWVVRTVWYTRRIRKRKVGLSCECEVTCRRCTYCT